MDFNETEWIKLVMLLADTHSWLQEISQQTLLQPPVPNKQKLLRPSYKLTISAMAHILERHYYKIPRHPGAGKFTIPVAALLHFIREAGTPDPQPCPGSLHIMRVLQTSESIGFDKNGEQASCITVITDAAGTIITAFPGLPALAGKG